MAEPSSEEWEELELPQEILDSIDQKNHSSANDSPDGSPDGSPEGPEGSPEGSLEEEDSSEEDSFIDDYSSIEWSPEWWSDWSPEPSPNSNNESHTSSQGSFDSQESSEGSPLPVTPRKNPVKRLCVESSSDESSEGRVETPAKLRKQEAPSTSTPVTVGEGLPDDVLLEVFAYLDTAQLLRSRSVCRRWRDLAVHRELWGRRVLDDKWDPMAVQTALRLATRAKSLRMHTSECLTVASTTDCAVEQLAITMDGDVDLVVDVVRLQRDLDRLKVLKLRLSLGPCDSNEDLPSFFSEPNDVEELDLRISNPRHGHFYRRPLPKRSSSLKKLSYTCSNSQDQLLVYLLRSHAPTLQVVHLVASHLSKLPYGVEAALAELPRLRELHCPLMPNTSALLGCRRLETLHLKLLSYSPSLLQGAESLLRGATGLRHLTLYAKKGVSGGMVSGLVEALTSKREGRSPLERLDVKLPLGPFGAGLVSHMLPPLAAALPRLQHLRVLDLSGQHTGPLSRLLSDLSAPSLRWLRVPLPARCPHQWLHQQEVQDLMQRNTLLHLRLTCGAICVAPCTLCSADCHRVLSERAAGLGAAVVFGHSESEPCGVPHGREDYRGTRVAWCAL